MRHIFRRFLGAFFQPGIGGKRDCRDFIDGRWNGGRLCEALSATKRLQLVGIHAVHHMVKQCAQSRITVRVVTALEHPIDGVVKIFARRLQVPGLEILLAGGKLFLNFLDQVGFSFRHRRQQGIRQRPLCVC